MFRSKYCTTVLLLCTLLPTLCWADDISVFFNRAVTPPAQQANLEDKIIELIGSAKSSLYIAIYDLDLTAIAHAIVAAKKRSVDVRLITDKDNIGHDNKLVLSILDQGGVPWIDDTENGSKGSGIQHNKFMIIDMQTVLTGSTNFTQSGIHGDRNKDGVLISQGNDNHIVIIDSVQLAEQFKQQFLFMWGDGPGLSNNSLFGLAKPDHPLTTVFTTHENIKIDVQFTPQSPSQYSGSSLDSIEKVILTAQKHIYLAQFVISSQNIANAMYARHQQGVAVKGLGDASFFSRYYSEFMDMKGIEKRSPKGLVESDGFTGLANNVWQKPADVRIANMTGGDKWHHKYVVVDNTVITGSHNLSGAAAFKNDENIVVIYDQQTAAEFAAHFNYSFCLAGNGQHCML